MIAIGCDHGGYELKEHILCWLKAHNIEYKDFGAYSEASVDYPVFAEKTARAVASGECELGLLFCGTGLGMSYAANKVRGVRAACCSEAFSAETFSAWAAELSALTPPKSSLTFLSALRSATMIAISAGLI